MQLADNKRNWLRVLTPVVGLASLTWFLVRVLPKPSRAAYPCQRAAFPLASGFVIWLAGLFGTRVMYRKSRDLMQRSRYAVALAALALAAFAVWLPLGWVSDATAQFIGNPEEHFQPSEGANKPMGVGKGIHPGRVTWIRDAGATLWDGKTGNWWDDANTDQKVVDSMISKSLAGLTGEKTDKQAWEALFQSFNQTHNFGRNGYQRGEKIAVKINANQDREKEWSTGRGVPSPPVIYSLVNQLITNAGVPGEDISIYEVTKARYISDPIVKRIWANPNPEFKKVRFVVEPDSARDGRIAAVPDMTQPGDGISLEPSRQHGQWRNGSGQGGDADFGGIGAFTGDIDCGNDVEVSGAVAGRGIRAGVQRRCENDVGVGAAADICALNVVAGCGGRRIPT